MTIPENATKVYCSSPSGTITIFEELADLGPYYIVEIESGSDVTQYRGMIAGMRINGKGNGELWFE